MLLILKRGGILFVILMLIVTILVFATQKRTKTASVDTNAIVIDAGHGGEDGGAVGTTTGVCEKEINLTIAKLLEQKLTAEGEHVVMTRQEDVGLYTDKDKTLREKKRSDMKARSEIGNTVGISMLVSIHMNHFTDAKYSGPQVFYAENVEGSKELADAIRSAFLQEIGPHCTREIKPVSGSLYLLRNAKKPAVIVECGFLSNAEEEKLLLTPSYQEALAQAIKNGIQKFKKVV